MHALLHNPLLACARLKYICTSSWFGLITKWPASFPTSNSHTALLWKKKDASTWNVTCSRADACKRDIKEERSCERQRVRENMSMWYTAWTGRRDAFQCNTRHHTLATVLAFFSTTPTHTHTRILCWVWLRFVHCYYPWTQVLASSNKVIHRLLHWQQQQWWWGMLSMVHLAVVFCYTAASIETSIDLLSTWTTQKWGILLLWERAMMMSSSRRYKYVHSFHPCHLISFFHIYHHVVSTLCSPRYPHCSCQ